MLSKVIVLSIHKEAMKAWTITKEKNNKKLVLTLPLE